MLTTDYTATGLHGACVARFGVHALSVSFTGFWSRPHEAKHIDDGLQEKLEDIQHRVSAVLRGNTAVSHK